MLLQVHVSPGQEPDLVKNSEPRCGLASVTPSSESAGVLAIAGLDGTLCCVGPLQGGLGPWVGTVAIVHWDAETQLEKKHAFADFATCCHS